jgi:hypothetical protein
MEYLIIWVVLIKTKNISLQQFLPLSETEIPGFLHPAQANHGFFSCVVLSSCPQHSLLNPMCLLKHVLNCKQNFGPEYTTSGLEVTGLARVYCTSVLLKQMVCIVTTVL